MSSKTMVIEPKTNPFALNLKEVWAYRDLLWTLTYRDIRVQYAQTAIGFTWAFIKPVISILLLTFIFGTVADVGTGGAPVPHILYTTVGMCGWTYFAAVLGQAGGSIIGAQNMVKKIYFPRLVIPLSKAITAIIDLAVVFLCIVLLMLYYGVAPSANITYLPFYIFIAIISGLAGGIWMSALTVRFRDFAQITPLLLQIGMYATPIAFPASRVPEKYQLLFHMNPMAGVVEGIRWSILGGTPPSEYAYISYIIISVLFVAGIFYFNQVQRKMADIL